MIKKVYSNAAVGNKIPIEAAIKVLIDAVSKLEADLNKPKKIMPVVDKKLVKHDFSE